MYCTRHDFKLDIGIIIIVSITLQLVISKAQLNSYFYECGELVTDYELQIIIWYSIIIIRIHKTVYYTVEYLRVK